MAAVSSNMAMRQTPLTCSGHTRPVVDLAFSGITPYGYFLISACKDGKPMLRQGDTGDWIGTFLGHKGAVWGATLNKEATKAATAAADFTAKVWDAVTGDEVLTLAHKHIDSNCLLTAGNDKVLRIYDLSKPESEPQEIAGHTSAIKKALWCNDDQQILSAAEDKTIKLWDKSTNEVVKTLSFEASVSSMEYVPDDEILVITHGRTIAFYKAHSLELIKSVDAPASIHSASLHPEKDFFVAGGDDFKLYNPDGELYASGSEDGTLRLWQTAVGKTYGLWKCVLPEKMIDSPGSAHNIMLDSPATPTAALASPAAPAPTHSEQAQPLSLTTKPRAPLLSEPSSSSSGVPLPLPVVSRPLPFSLLTPPSSFHHATLHSHHALLQSQPLSLVTKSAN
ncbi:hypothetical protein DNTS_033241 [Danionella cerebrum]|uniref:Serine-threonine kinase receptor-associated protein n=1 Tax=Danionella cerebrum TaxID=2873325 RepID=A0A553MPM2_9TELE|nr:hypothetical protein DNTS_033241 [Danionella translucida]